VYECPACHIESLVTAWADAMGYCPECGEPANPMEDTP
jgi:hypothetical protein